MRESWPDEWLDDLNAKVDRGFDRMDAEFGRVNSRFDSLDDSMLKGFLVLCGFQVTLFVAIATLFVALH